MSIILFRRKPSEVEAMCFDGTKENANQILAWIGSYGQNATKTTGLISIQTLEGHVSAIVGDWVIKDESDEFYPCDSDVFAETYEPVETPAEEPDFLAGTAACSLNPEEDECSACQ